MNRPDLPQSALPLPGYFMPDANQENDMADEFRLRRRPEDKAENDQQDRNRGRQLDSDEQENRERPGPLQRR